MDQRTDPATTKPAPKAREAADEATPRHFGSIFTMLGFCVLVVAGLWAAIGLFLAHEREQVYTQARRDGNNLAIAFERDIDGIVRSVDSALLHLRQERQESLEYLEDAARSLKSGPLGAVILAFGVIDQDGMVSWWSEPPSGPIFLGDRPHFVAHKSTSEDRLIISPAFYGRITKRWSVHFSRRLTAADGSFAGVVVISVAVEHFSRFLGEIDVGPHGAIGVLHASGSVISRSSRMPGADQAAGKAYDLSPLRDFPGQTTAWWLRPSPIDGVPRLTTYRRHAEHPLAVTVSLAEEDILADYLHLRSTMIQAGLVISLSLCLFAAWLLRTERRRLDSERRANENESRFRRMFEKAPLAYHSLDPNGRIIEVNEAWEELFGYRLAEVRGQSIGEFVSAASGEQFTRTFPELIRNGRIDNVEFEIVRKDGSTRLVNVNGRTSTNVDGSVRQTHSILTDVTQTRQQEARLRASEAQLRNIIEGVSVATWELDLATWQFTYVSPQLEAILGYPAADWLTLNFWPEHIHPEDRVWAVQYCVSSTHRAEDHDFEYRMLAQDGRTVWVRDIVKVVVDTSGKPARLAGVMVDITAEKTATAELAGKEALLRSLIDSVPDLIFFKDQDGVYLGSNRAFAEFVGRPESEQIGKTDYDFFDQDTAELFRARDSDMLDCGEPRRNEEWVTYPDGRRVLLDTLKTPFLGPKGEPLGVIGISRDITVLRAAEESMRRSEARLRSYLENSIDGICVTDANGRFIEVNPAAAAIFGYSRHEFLHLSIADTVPADAEAQTREISGFEQLQRDGSVRLQRLARRHDGSLIWIEVNAARIDSNTYLGIVRDVTERVHNEDSLRLAQSVFESTTEGIMVTDTDSRILSVNPAFTRITGWPAEDAIGRKPSILKSGRHPAEFYAALWKTLKANGHWAGEIWNRHRDGDVFVEWIAINAIPGSSGETVKYVGMFSDITQRKQQEEQIWRQANFDALTGLPNRNLFHDRLERALARARRNQQQVGLMFIDLDRFKWVNDTLGHAAGDRLLVEASARLAACVREEDTVARLGGDEFTVVLQGLTDHEPLQAVAEKILEALARAFELEGTQQHISGSIGITIFPDDGESSAKLLRNADIAMYQAKEGGRNRYQFYSHEMQVDALARLQIEQELRVAVDTGAFVLHYQPIVDADSGELLAAEALLRWQHPERGLIAPAEFLGIAEETGLMLPIGEWVIAEVCRQWRAWVDAGHPPLHLTINISNVHFRDPGLHDCLAREINRHRVGERMLTLEVTEGLLLGRAGANLTRLQELQSLGLRYSLDDFGTGYSSLSTLKRFPFESVKIDRSFIAECTTSIEDAHLIEAIVFMAHSLGLVIVAEGVETVTQLDFLRDLGCDHAQGFLVSQPLPADAFSVLLTRRVLLPDVDHTAEEARFLAALRRDNIDPEPWVRRLLAERDPALAEYFTATGCRIGDLDLCMTIVAHLQWRGRLEAMILDDSFESMTVADAGDDLRCTLGHWLEGQRLTPTARHASYRHLIEVHREFHRLAASILEDLKLGRRGEARRRTRGLIFRKASHQVVTGLVDLFVEEHVTG